MPDIQQILGAEHEIYTTNRDAWQREERRFYGRDAVLGDGTTEVELERFTNEQETSYRSRKAQATYLNFPLIHAKILAGHLARVAPMPNYGTLGEVRPRDAIAADNETVAESFHYNCDGVGKDGTQFRAWTTGVQERAIATGHRWVMVEMPRRPNANGPVRGTDIRAGFRPFLVEYSPLAVPMWESTDGRLDWMVIRPRIRKGGQLWEPSNTEDGYYLLVRQGYVGLGDQFSGGGWWLFHGDKTPVENGRGTWARTGGQIPVAALVAESSQGTTERPAMSGSLTMELGQIATSLMNRISERNWDARDAAKSVKYILGAEKDAFNLMIEHHEANSILVPVIGSATPDGKWLIPSIYDSSAGAVAADVFSTIIRSTIEEAHEIMVRQLTSEPDSSGRSKEVGFGEATSPLLASLAARRESFENTLIYFAELRAGATSPSGFVVWPTEFELAPTVEKIDRTIERMLKLGARSATLEAHMVESAAKDDGVWPEGQDEAAIRDELETSLASARVPEQSESASKLSAAGYTAEGVASVVGFTDEQQQLLVGGPETGSVDQTNPDAAVVTSGAESGADRTGQPETEGGPQGPIPAGTRTPDTAPNAQRPQPPSAPSGSPPSQPSPDPSIEELRAEVAGLTAQVSALVAALAAKPEPSPAPIVLPIAMPQPAPAGKNVSVTEPNGRTWTVNVTPTTSNGTNPPNTSNPE